MYMWDQAVKKHLHTNVSGKTIARLAQYGFDLAKFFDTGVTSSSAFGLATAIAADPNNRRCTLQNMAETFEKALVNIPKQTHASPPPAGNTNGNKRQKTTPK